MQIKILVKRQASQHEKSYTQEFTYNGDGKLTVADWLNEINRTKAADNRIAWECGCLEKKCGACAMLINGIPVLACSAFCVGAVLKYVQILWQMANLPEQQRS